MAAIASPTPPTPTSSTFIDPFSIYMVPHNLLYFMFEFSLRNHVKSKVHNETGGSFITRIARVRVTSPNCEYAYLAGTGKRSREKRSEVHLFYDLQVHKRFRLAHPVNYREFFGNKSEQLFMVAADN